MDKACATIDINYDWSWLAYSTGMRFLLHLGEAWTWDQSERTLNIWQLRIGCRAAEVCKDEIPIQLQDPSILYASYEDIMWVFNLDADGFLTKNRISRRVVSLLL